MSQCGRRRAYVLALVFASQLATGSTGCGQQRESRPVAEVAPPDLVAAGTGGAASLASAPGFAFIPEEAVVVGTADPGELFGSTSWRARVPTLAGLGGELQKGGFDPVQTRFLFFATPSPAGEAAAVVVASTRLEAPAGARREVVLGAEVLRVDGADVGLAPLPNLTVLGPEGALRRALEAGLGKVRPLARLAGVAGIARFSAILERMPAASLARLAAVSSPLLTRLFAGLSAGATPEGALVWEAGLGATAAGAALYLHGSGVRFVAVLQLGSAAGAEGFVVAAKLALAALGRDGVVRTREERLWTTLVAAASVRAHEGYAFVESEVAADLLVALLSR